MDLPVDISLILSGASTLFTSYFWFIKANKERPALEFVQLSEFMISTRGIPDRKGYKRIFFQHRESGGVLIVNHSARQNSVIRFACFLETDEGEVAGDWGYDGDDKPPWNVGPETALAFSPVCFFDLPEDVEISDNPKFRVEFITASGRRFLHEFQKTPNWEKQRVTSVRRRAA